MRASAQDGDLRPPEHPARPRLVPLADEPRRGFALLGPQAVLAGDQLPTLLQRDEAIVRRHDPGRVVDRADLRRDEQAVVGAVLASPSVAPAMDRPLRAPGARGVKAERDLDDRVEATDARGVAAALARAVTELAIVVVAPAVDGTLRPPRARVPEAGGDLFDPFEAGDRHGAEARRAVESPARDGARAAT